MDATRNKPVDHVGGHDLNSNDSSQSVTSSPKPCRQVDRDAVLPPKNLPLQILRRRSCRPLVVGMSETENDTSCTDLDTATGEGRRSGAGIGRRHSVSFMPSAARRHRTYDDEKEGEIDGHRRTAGDNVDDDDSSPERRLVQRTPTPYYEEPPSLLEDQHDEENTGNQMAMTTMTTTSCVDDLIDDDAGSMRLRALRRDDVIADADLGIKYSDIITSSQLSAVGHKALCVVGHDSNGLDDEEISQALSQIR